MRAKVLLVGGALAVFGCVGFANAQAAMGHTVQVAPRVKQAQAEGKSVVAARLGATLALSKHGRHLRARVKHYRAPLHPFRPPMSQLTAAPAAGDRARQEGARKSDAPLSNFLPSAAVPSTSPNPDGTYNETTGGWANTWTNYTNAGGYQGQSIPPYTTIEVACVVQGFQVSDGNTNWYLIASPPWSYNYYVTADAEYNNGQTSGPLQGTPFVDPSVPDCNSGVNGVPETAGGAANTWTNYMNAGGNQGPTVGGGATIIIACKLHGFQVSDGNTWWYQIASRPWNGGYYVTADAFYNNGQTSGSLQGTPFVDPNVPDCTSNGGGGSNGTNEITGGSAHTWTNYTNAGGSQGPTIPGGTTVSITCKVTGFQVSDGNTWWYQIGSAPWSNAYYVTADAFYNNGQSSGSLLGTPFVDYAVPDCAPGQVDGGGGGSPPPRGTTEFTGGSANTWSNYSDAGGQSGGTIPGGTSVAITCRVQGFRVSDGNTWWYLIASPSWQDYFVTADAFYNNGATSGSLQGTPFVDTAVPICTGSQEALLYSTSLATGQSASHSPTCTYGSYPVNCASGDFWHAFTDVSIPGRGSGLTLSRTYNSLAPSSEGLFGYGWTSDYDQHLLFNSNGRSDGSIVVVLEDGSQITATPSGGNSYTTPPATDTAFQQNADGTYTLTLHHLTIETFSSSGQLLSISDLNGNSTTLSYNGAGQLTTIADASGRDLSVAFGSNGLVSSVSDPMGRTTTYGYDAAGDLTSTTDPLGRTWNFTYDANHRMLTMTDPRGGVVTNTYDSTGRVVKQVDPAGLATTFAYTGDNYGPVGGTTTITDPHGNVRLEQYANGFLMQVTKAVGQPTAATTSYEYDPTSYGQTSVTDPQNNVTTHTYDASGHVLTTTDADGATTTNTYNSLGELSTTTTPLGEVTTNTYDGNGNLLSTTDALGETTTYAYGDASNPGKVTLLTDPDGRATQMTYDSHGDLASRTISPTAGTHDTTTYAYNGDSELVCQVSANATALGISCPTSGRAAKTTTNGYDADGELISVTDPNGHTTLYGYDSDGNRTSVTDASGNETTTAYDADNRVTRITTGANAAGSSTISTAYDVPAGTGSCPASGGASYCTTTTNPSGAVTTHVFDTADHEIETIRPGSQITLYTYDPAGNRTSETTPNGNVINYTYDNDNRLIGLTAPGVTPVTYTFNTDGERTTMTDASGTTTYTYDSDGRLTSIDEDGQSVAYTYDHAGHITTITYPNGHQISRTFNGAGWLASTTDWLGNTTSFSYDANGNEIGTTYPNGDTVATSYDLADNVTGTTAKHGGTVLAGIAYQRTAANLISQETDSDAIQQGALAEAYNAKNQLTSMGAGAFGYDSTGNLTGNNGAIQVYNTANELTSATSPGQSTSFAYDADGNRTAAKPVWGRTTSYSYNALDELTSVSQPPSTPSVSGLSAASGSPAGGGSITITGHGFNEASAVNFGTRPASSFTVASDSSLQVVVPAHATGPVDVTVVTPGGTSATGNADVYTYNKAPGVTGINPTAGPTTGGTTLTITGAGFLGTKAVLFGSKRAGSFTVVSANKIKATIPAGTKGLVNVVVKTPQGASQALPASGYTYINGTAITAISPTAGPTAGGTTLTIRGSGLNGATSVTIGGISAKFTVQSKYTIQVVTPAHTLGSAPVIVQTPGGRSPNTTADRYSYQALPVVTSIGPPTGTASGGNVATITGQNLSGSGATVYFGATAAPTKALSATTLLAIVPSGTGTSQVTVRSAGGTSKVTAADNYSYTPATTNYIYNGDGLRMRSTSGGNPTPYVWDTTGSIPELLSDSTASYIYGPNGAAIEQIDATNTPSYYFHDAIGSTRALLGQSGSISATFTYSPYGALTSKTGSATTPLQFAGYYADGATGLYYTVNRYYDPNTGQFTSVDPAVDQTNAVYDYAGDDPTNDTDPLGLFSFHALWDGIKSTAASYVLHTVWDVYSLGKEAVATWSACSQNWLSYACEESYQSFGVDLSVTIVSQLCDAAGPAKEACNVALSAGGTFLLDRYGYHGDSGGTVNAVPSGPTAAPPAAAWRCR